MKPGTSSSVLALRKLQRLRGPAYPLLNLLLFKLSWLLLVVGQERGLPWALALQGLSLALHPALRAALLPWLAVAGSGITLDFLLLQAGVFVFPHGFPAWLVLLWLAFALALPQGLGFLRHLALPWQLLTGALLGPFSYALGQRLAAVDFGLDWLPTLALLAGLWALFLPLALRAAQWRLPPAVLLVLLSLPGLLPAEARADTAAATGPATPQLIGQTRLNWLFKPIYEAYLYAPEQPFTFPDSGDFIFKLIYRLDLKRENIVRETLRQWEKQNVSPQPVWVQELERLIPDIRAGDSLALEVSDGRQARLLHNDTPVGSIDDAGFVQAFAGIWLAASTTRPDLRQQLLGLP